MKLASTCRSNWADTCPLTYVSSNTPSKADVLGSWMLSVLSGHKRYSHVTAIRCDGVNPPGTEKSMLA